jgi:hypothetical protein
MSIFNVFELHKTMIDYGWVRATFSLVVTLSSPYALFVWTYQHNQQPSSSVFLSQQTSEQYFQHNKPAKRTGCIVANAGNHRACWTNSSSSVMEKFAEVSNAMFLTREIHTYIA